MKRAKFFLLFIVLLLGGITTFAQGWRNAGRPGFGNGYGRGGFGPGSCLMYLTGLTEDQKTKIIAQETSHQAGMAELRVKQQSLSDPDEKIATRIEMLQKVLAHRGEVRKLLTEEQQKQYDLLQNGNFYGRRGFAPGYGRGPGGRRGGFGYRGGW